MPVFFGRREFVIVKGLKCHPPLEPVPEYIVKKEQRRRKKGEKKAMEDISIQPIPEHVTKEMLNDLRRDLYGGTNY